jgi:cytochrome b561
MRLAAHLSNYALYASMIAMPLIGWAMLSARNLPLVVFGVSVPAPYWRRTGSPRVSFDITCSMASRIHL